MKPGYKQTEVGVIPEEWEVKKLGEVGESLIGLTYNPLDISDQGILVLRSSNIQNDSLSFDDNVFVNARIPDRIMIQPGDVLICVRNGSRALIGKAVFLDDKAIGMTFGAFMSVYRSKIGILVNYLLQSSILKKQIDEHLGATINQITNKSLNSFQIPLPPLPEQRAIAAALSDVDALLGGLERLIAKKRDLKQAAMQQLLTGQTRLPGFDGAWEVKTIGAVCQSYSGGTPSTTKPEFYGGEIPFIRSAEIARNKTELSLTSEGLINSSAKMITKGDVLVALYGANSGDVALATIDGAINQAILCLKSEESNAFLYQFLSFKKNWIVATFIQGGQGNLSGEIIKSITLSFPPLPEQIAIAAMLSDMDAELVALEQRRTKTRALKQAMMQELLTGRTRLMDN
jgi:type I restriction enzyme, S subunit